MYERLGDEDAPLHAARENPHGGVCFVRKPEVREDLVDPVVVMADAPVSRLKAKGFAHGKERVERDFLRHDAERQGRGTAVFAHVHASHEDPSARRRREPRKARDQRGLPGAVGSEKAEEFAFLDIKAHAPERLRSGSVAFLNGIKPHGRDAHFGVPFLCGVSEN